MLIKPIYKIYIKDKPIHDKINKIINKDKTHMYMRENTLKNLNYVNKLKLTEVCILFKVGLCFKINKLSK